MTEYEIKIRDIVVNDPEMVKYFKGKFINEDLWSYCIETEPSLFKYNKTPSRRLCKHAVEMDGSNITYVPKEYIDERMIFTLLTYHPDSIKDVSKEYNKFISKDLILHIVAHSPEVYERFADRIDTEMLNNLVNINPIIVKYCKKPNEDLVCKALKTHPLLALNFSCLTNRMMDVIDKYHPEFKDKLPHYTRNKN